MLISIFFDIVQVRTAIQVCEITEFILVILFDVKKYVKSVVLVNALCVSKTFTMRAYFHVLENNCVFLFF